MFTRQRRHPQLPPPACPAPILDVCWQPSALYSEYPSRQSQVQDQRCGSAAGRFAANRSLSAICSAMAFQRNVVEDNWVVAQAACRTTVRRRTIQKYNPPSKLRGNIRAPAEERIYANEKITAEPWLGMVLRVASCSLVCSGFSCPVLTRQPHLISRPIMEFSILTFGVRCTSSC